MSEQNTRPPRVNVIRAVNQTATFRSAEDLNEELGSGYLGLLEIRFSPVNEWTEIRSHYENDGVPFLERFVPGAWKKTIRERRDKIKALFQHGQDPQIGDKPLGPFRTIEEDDGGGYAEVKLLDTSYNRDLLPGLKEGLYGSSHRFESMVFSKDPNPERSDHNPNGLMELSVKEARLHELGPVTFPAYAGATAGVRSMTDEFIFRCIESDPEKIRSMISIATDLSSKPRDVAVGVGTVTLETQDPAPEPTEAASAPQAARAAIKDQGKHVLVVQNDPRPHWAL